LALEAFAEEVRLSGRAKSTKRKFSIAICAAVLLGGSASFWPMVSIGIVQAQVAEKAVIKGFRSAQFGMNEPMFAEPRSRISGSNPRISWSSRIPRRRRACCRCESRI
jgi:hypothetical protein